MQHPNFKLKPLEQTQLIPVRWEFSQDDYDKMVEGHRSNWYVYLSNDVVHICRVLGEEFYRFKLNQQVNGNYFANNLETYEIDAALQTKRNKGSAEADIQSEPASFVSMVLEEVTGLLNAYFDIEVPAKVH